MKLGIIGTAGRDKNYVHDRALWDAMTTNLGRIIANIKTQLPPQEIEAVSGGAAWADHLAVWAFQAGLVDRLTVHMPSSWDHERRTYVDHCKCGGISNYYHRKFSAAIGENTLGQLADVGPLDDTLIYESPVANNMGAFFQRNGDIAKSLTSPTDLLLAYTWGEGTKPADGGTLDTWKKAVFVGKKHISLHLLT